MQGNKAQRLNFPNLRDTYKQLIAEGDKSAPDFLAKAVAAASAVAKRMGTTALVRTASGRGGSRPRSAIAAARTLLVSGESDDEEEEDEDGDHEDEEEDEDGMLLYGDDEEEEEDERTASLPDSPADRATARSGPGSGAGGSRQQQQPAAAAASPPASGEQAAAQVSSTVLVRQRAAELAAQFPISAAFSCGPAVALVRLEAGLLAGSGGFGWGMRFLAIPAAASMAQVKAVVAAGLAEALGRALPAACVGLVVQNDLDSSADFDALCCEDPGTGNLLLRDQITVRSARLCRTLMLARGVRQGLLHCCWGHHPTCLGSPLLSLGGVGRGWGRRSRDAGRCWREEIRAVMWAAGSHVCTSEQRIAACSACIDHVPCVCSLPACTTGPCCPSWKTALRT